MSELISGKEAKLAWANGKKLQIANMIVGEDFYDIDDSNTTINIFDLDFYQFRLKPRTITINGIEVPAPFEPENDDEKENSYVITLGGGKFHWRTSSDYNQVVAALRSVFKPQ